MPAHDDLRLGTLVPGPHAATYLPQVLAHGFESFQLTFGKTLGGLDLSALAGSVRHVLGEDDSGARVSSLGIFGNPLGDEPLDAETRAGWESCIDHAAAFGTDLVCGFTGRVRGRPIPESLPRYVEVFGPLAKRAADRGVRLAFENCAMGGDWNAGDWNIAHGPAAWRLMFDALPDRNVGLEWEPCHQMVQLMDPLPQLREWLPTGRVFHLHGKDATIHWDVVRRQGILGAEPFAFHRTPGFGDTNWTDVISELRRARWRGSIDIEGWHDPVYRDELEMTGQVHGLHYLKHCRGGAFVPNPDVPEKS